MRALPSIGFAIALASCSAGTVSAAPRPFLRLPGAVPASMGYPPGDGTLYSFSSGADANPYGGLIAVDGVLYGTTCPNGPGKGSGTVFAVNAARTELVLHRFGGGTDGACPKAALVDVNGVLYGTTLYGGKYNLGTVFQVTTNGTERVLHSFGSAADGASPEAALVDFNGTLYGTTSRGGKYTWGTVFAITPAGIEHVLHNFGHGTDGVEPLAGLVVENGVLYGTTVEGGGVGWGTVFEVTTAGTDERVLYSFRNGSDGRYPFGGLIEVNGVFYGTTYGGDTSGSVFALTKAGTIRELHTFGGGTDGAVLYNSLIDVNGVLYGTTSGGGKYGNGTIFSITTTGSERVVRDFSFNRYPQCTLIEVNGVLYGTSNDGGTYNSGTIFFQSP